MHYQTETEFQQAVIEYAELKGWWVWKDYDSRRNKAGWPDLFLWRNGYIIFVELKKVGGKRTKIQDEMAGRLMMSETRSKAHAIFANEAGELEVKQNPVVRYFLWTPADWDQIEEVL